MTITVSPLDLLLDPQNPRFVILASREQADIRKYLLTFEDVAPLATAINDYGSLLPGERIVTVYEEEKYIAVEGNRRTCALQLLLSRSLIPDGFGHKIPAVTEILKQNCQTIEVDVLPNRDAAIGLMSKRHIEGVKQWRPLAKKQFFAANYSTGRSVQDLSRISGISEAQIKSDIRDYKFFLGAYDRYRSLHTEFTSDIINLKVDPFWRIFKAKFVLPGRQERVSPSEVLKISYNDDHCTTSDLDSDLFDRIVQLVFRESIVTEGVNTRNVLTDVEGILSLLESILSCPDTHQAGEQSEPDNSDGSQGSTDQGSGDKEPTSSDSGRNGASGIGGVGNGNTGTSGPGGANGGNTGAPSADAPDGGNDGTPGPEGPVPPAFFEAISWRDKLIPSNTNHQGLITALSELYRFSITNCGRQKAYKVFPIATGMTLRTAYEQALRMRLIQLNLWGNFCSTLRNNAFPTLKGIEDFISQGGNKGVVFPRIDMVLAYDRVIAASHRDFLNANIHYPGNIRVSVTSDSLEGIAAGGMFHLIQSIINLA